MKGMEGGRYSFIHFFYEQKMRQSMNVMLFVIIPHILLILISMLSVEMSGNSGMNQSNIYTGSFHSRMRSLSIWTNQISTMENLTNKMNVIDLLLG